MRARFLMLIVLALLSGCARPLPPVDPSRTIAPTAVDIYRLGVGDKVKLTVYKEPTLTGEYRVGADGTISVPVVGAVQAGGQTPQQIAETVRASLAGGFMVNPQVSAEVAEYRPIYVLGEVNKPGRYDYAIGLTLLGAIAAAEGFSYRADDKRAFIKGKDEVGEKEYRVTADLVVHPGDIIRVGARSF